MEKRSEARNLQQIELYVHLDECEEDPALIGESFECRALDVSPHGIKLLCDELLFEGNQLNITIGVGEPFSLYMLRGEIRWVKETDLGYQLGIKLAKDDLTDYERWVAEFNEIFKEDPPEEDDLDAFLRSLD